MNERLVRISKTLSLLLRHAPDRFGVRLDGEGWAEVEDVLEGLRAAGLRANRDDLDTVVAENDKRRFAFSDDGASIRASQGHSVAIDLGLQVRRPPALLFHGTVRRFLDSIREHGLRAGARQHVHLSATAEAARAVGARRGTAIVLEVASGTMHQRGYRFYRSDNGVWLTDAVPPEFLDLSAVD